MPVLSRFYGIIVIMYWRDHSPPHFHAKYGGLEVVVNVRTGEVHGQMPRRAMGMIENWRRRHGADLLRAWEQAQSGEPVEAIDPLELTMILHVEEARYVRSHVIWVRFNDGASGDVDLAGDLKGPVFEPLRVAKNFRRFRVDPELDTIVWFNGADLAPEFLRDRLHPGRAPSAARKVRIVAKG